MARTRLIPLTLLSIVVLLRWPVLADDKQDLAFLTGETMGTSYSIRVPVSDANELIELEEQVERRLAEINQLMSTYREDSEVSRFNRSQETEWFPVSRETAEVVAAALEVSRQSDGAFDITVAPLVNLWHFGPDRSEHKLPSDEELAAARAAVGYEKLEVRLNPPALKKADPALTIDLSAIAKGYGVDAVAEVLGERPCMVEIGGEVYVRGVKVKGDRWRLGIEAPTPGERKVYTTVDLEDQALATSGDYRNFVEIDGKTYSHTIDPRTGRPVQHTLRSASILAENCMRADAVATTIMVLGPEAGFDWVEEHGVDALLLSEADGKIIERSTAGFAAARDVSDEADSGGSKQFLTMVVAAVVIIGLAILGMSVGAIFRGKCITGSCGGLANLPGSDVQSACEVCANRTPECDERAAQAGDSAPDAPAE